VSDTLVIHLNDPSTEFLKLVYEGKGYNVINDGTFDDKQLLKELKSHEKIIMMGHGTPTGLINPQKELYSVLSGYFINKDHIDILKEKETISIWCWSDRFFKKYQIPGFHTGVIISETAEEQFMLGGIPLNREELLENMEFMARCFNQCIDKSPKEIQSYMRKHYNRDDQVSKFNRKMMIVL
jgi:hypothetical protein